MRTRAVVLLVVGAVACGRGDVTVPNAQAPVQPTPNVAPTDTVVSVEQLSYTPTEVTVTVGSTVTWKWTCTTNPDPAGNPRHCAPHTVTFDQGTFASATQATGTYQRRFMERGTYTYYCVVHPTLMIGKVVVR